MKYNKKCKFILGKVVIKMFDAFNDIDYMGSFLYGVWIVIDMLAPYALPVLAFCLGGRLLKSLFSK